MTQTTILDAQSETVPAMMKVAPVEDISRDCPADALCISMLGGFRISFNDLEIPETAWRLGKARSLIKLLALSPGHSLHREQIIDLLWPELSPEAGLNNFHQVLLVARRTLATILPAANPTDTLNLRRQMLSLAPPVNVRIDVEAFEQALASMPPKPGPDVLYHVIEMYGGDLLPEDRYEEWTRDRREYLHEQYVSLLLQLAGIHESRREANLAIDVLRRVVSIEPLREEAHASLMRVYALSDRRQQAIRQYERLRDTLERELDAPPDPIVTELHAAIVAGIYPVETWRAEPVTPPLAEPSFELSESIQTFLQRKTDFVDREDELRIFESALTSAISSVGKIVLLAGEPGIGKTRLVEEFSRYAEAHRIPVYLGHDYEGVGSPPYWPWTQIVREYVTGHRPEMVAREMGTGAADIARIVPEIHSVVSGIESLPAVASDQERFRLFDSMSSFLKTVAERTPVVIVLEDLHWFDRSSLLMLEFLAHEIQQSRIVIIGSYRPVEVDRGHPLIHALATLARLEMTERVYLSGLSPENVARYSEIALGETPPEGLSEAIHFQTSGNPFFVREIVQLLIDEERIINPQEVRSWKLTIPHGIRETVHLRADRLSEAAYRLLASAAVVGFEFELDVLAAASNQPAAVVLDAIEEALALGLLVEVPSDPERFRFSHAITRQTVYDDLSQARRLRMHLQTGEAIERIHASTLDEQLSELAHHFATATSFEPTDKAIDYLVRAGKRSMEQLGYSEASLLFQRALQLIELSNRASERVEVLLLLAEAQLYGGETVQARERYEQIATIAREGSLVEVFAQAALGFRACGSYFNPADEPAVRLLEEALTLLENEKSLVRVQVLSRLSDAQYHRGSSESRRVELARLAVDVAHELGDPEALGTSQISLLGADWDHMTPADRVRLSSEANSHAHQSNNPQLVLTTSTWRITALMEAGNVHEADREIADYLGLATYLRQPQNIWSGLTRQCMRALMSGDFEVATGLKDQALEIGLRCAPGSAQLTEFTHRFLIEYLARGNLDGLRGEVQQLVLDNPHFPLLECVHGLTLLRIGQRHGAQAVLDRLMEHALDELPGNTLRLPTLALFAELVHGLQDESRAGRLLDIMRKYEGHNVFGGNSICFGAADHFLGLLHATTGDIDRARNHFKGSVAANSRMNALPFVARDELAWGRTLSQSPDPAHISEAHDHLHRAVEVARATGMTDLIQRAITILENQPTGQDRMPI